MSLVPELQISYISSQNSNRLLNIMCDLVASHANSTRHVIIHAMNKHKMNLQPKYYDFIKDGTKRIELRLYDEKRQEIKLGDEIEFSKSETEKIHTRVIGLIRYQSFEDLFKDFPIEILADKTMTKDELLGVLSEFYTKEKQQEFGVVGIRIKII